jgi:hypothetical protein
MLTQTGVKGQESNPVLAWGRAFPPVFPGLRPSVLIRGKVLSFRSRAMTRDVDDSGDSRAQSRPPHPHPTTFQIGVHLRIVIPSHPRLA